MGESRHCADEQGRQFGFIKFGSRIDVLLHLGAKINVGIGKVVKGGKTVLTKLKGWVLAGVN